MKTPLLFLHLYLRIVQVKQSADVKGGKVRGKKLFTLYVAYILYIQNFYNNKLCYVSFSCI